MSSFLAHSLMAVTIYSSKSRNSINRRWNLLWLIWLIVMASFPDLDYAIPLLNSSNNQGLRITHSILFSLIAPITTIALLKFFQVRNKNVIKYGLQAIGAGLSHLVLDLLVGVTPLPLLFPLSFEKFKLPFGILPSAGRIDLSNYYLYRNLYLEMGVLLPLCLGLYLLNNKKINYVIKAIAVTFLFLCSGYFINQCYLLPR